MSDMINSIIKTGFMTHTHLIGPSFTDTNDRKKASERMDSVAKL